MKIEVGKPSLTKEFSALADKTGWGDRLRLGGYGIFATPVAFLIGKDGVIARNVAMGPDQIMTLAHEGLTSGLRRTTWKIFSITCAAVSWHLWGVSAL